MTSLLQTQRERVGRRIRNARITAGLSHDRLAARVGTSRQHLIKLEKGQHLPRPEMLARIADETGRPESYFTSDDDEDDHQVTFAVAIQQLLDRAAEHAVRQAVARHTTRFAQLP